MEHTLKTISMDLSARSIDKAIKEINKFKEDLARALEELARYVTEEKGVGIAKMYVAQFPAVDTGALHDSIKGTYEAKNHMGVITAGEGLVDGSEDGKSYAFYVEYGTGIVGKQNPHPDPNGYQYDVNEHGSGGWYYKSEKGWYKPKDGGPRLAWTKGMPARPFMYNTMLTLEEEVEREGGRIIAEYIPQKG